MTDLRPQSEGFSYYRVPRQLVKGREFRPLSPAGKLLFSLLLDRVSLSVRNGWKDREGQTYVCITPSRRFARTSAAAASPPESCFRSWSGSA